MAEELSQAPSKSRFSPVRLISGIFYIIVGLLSLLSYSMFDLKIWFEYNLEFLQSPSGYFFFGLYGLLKLFLLPIGSVFMGVTALASKNFRYWAWISIGLFVVVGLFGWLLTLFEPIILGYGGLNLGIDTLRLSWTGSWLDWPLTIFFVAATVLAVFSKSSTSTSDFGPYAAATSHSDSSPNDFHIQRVAPSNLPVFSLVAAFIVPVAAVILGHISLSQMKRGQIVSDNRGLALAGLILGYVFIGLSFIFGIILIVALLINGSLTSYYY